MKHPALIVAALIYTIVITAAFHQSLLFFFHGIVVEGKVLDSAQILSRASGAMRSYYISVQYEAAGTTHTGNFISSKTRYRRGDNAKLLILPYAYSKIMEYKERTDLFKPPAVLLGGMILIMSITLFRAKLKNH